MFHLPRQHFGRRSAPDLGKPLEHLIPADDPEHGESSQGVDGVDSLAGGLERLVLDHEHPLLRLFAVGDTCCPA
jgi:hypothetical protein